MIWQEWQPLRALEINTREYGNALILCAHRGSGEQRVLKVYRPRANCAKELLGSLSHRLFEGKSSQTPAARYACEKAMLRHWHQLGFGVPAVWDAADDTGESLALWLEYFPGKTLFRMLGDHSRETETHTLLAAWASEFARRQRLALERGDVLLIQEHADFRHVLLRGESWVTIDHESAYRAEIDMRWALGHELAAYLRSLYRAIAGSEEQFKSLLATFAKGYGDRALLDELSRGYQSPRGLFARVHVWEERKRRGDHSHAAFLDRLQEAAGAL